MSMDYYYRPRHMKISNGCWTCRLRRKKCDENHPTCHVCLALHITCYFDKAKPEWMDGGARQEEMAERLKREVKEKAPRRRGERAVQDSGDRGLETEADLSMANPDNDIHNDVIQVEIEPSPGFKVTSATIKLPQRGADCKLKQARESIAFGRSDTILLTFYLQHLFPFLFPFYQPSLLHQGGRAWVLEMMISSPVVRQATLCQSSYFFSLAQGMANWEAVLAQTRGAFGILRQSLQVIDGSGNITEHLHGAVRIMAGIMQVQRFEIAVLSFNNCQAHLNAALALFRQLLDSGSTGAVGLTTSFNTNFNDVLCRLGPSSWILSGQDIEVPSAEQAAFRFSSALLIFDDIIASTVLQEQPRLYDYYRSLLGTVDSIYEPPINLEAVVGCQNWVLLQIADIAVLDAWKQRCKGAGNLDVMELVRRATAIKDSLEIHLTRLETDPVVLSGAGNNKGSSLLDVFTAGSDDPGTPASQRSLVTRVWAHAALVYLFVVVSGWQPASADIRYHVSRIIELLTRQISPPALLRTMVWPFCVAGCLAEPAQEAHLRAIVEVLQPPSVFGTARKALEIMEKVWRSRDAGGDLASHDLATCFRSQGDLVLLV
ncbi:fungal-specific transcription factor domain-containing protein [Pseudomassariella vexata]|uniref:Fungal-specific transcription factor domain-domain-containing protein n=1 Tax=Pseudomassariella vexata TaxID=1141098 RepID=A0A1Y2DBH4_9PEZI|nr:fungal-specific transcription factor domain-containing protein [Pseudomassariella vexata]ORY56612.1 fungal-specific transcription factor domain-domain-containing protein [Pseudomassariella vexata]